MLKEIISLFLENDKYLKISSKMETNNDEVEFTTNKADYEMLEVLGQGATAHVQVACFTCPKTGKKKKVAVKRIQFEEFSSSLKSISTEVGLMTKCRHEHIGKIRLREFILS